MKAQDSLLSPKQFLGSYTQNFTPHHKVVAYAEYLANHSPRVALYHYGKTYEGRPLVYLAISKASNIQRLEEIRKNHLASLGMEGGTVTDSLLRTFVWLSHGVHGNEAAATESAILNMYTLAKGSSDIVVDLSKTIVIIDPCLNPDGFDRYVQFYRMLLGESPNAIPLTSEHHEPWPSGRVNHYQFDLNRDWAWQTQTESQQRMVAYYEWMPHIHVDIHEQYPESPYYFAPAAPPFHKEIEDWQLQLQEPIGKNNAKYFDSNGWPYFTGETFDLFYPSYGDTYPILNGAIGMTYEQAGHGIAGLQFLLNNNDTLTLADRILHHHTASMATIESTIQLHDTLLQLQQDYFTAYEPREYRAYLFKVNDGKQLSLKNSFLELLDKNQIQYQLIDQHRPGKPVDIWSFENERTERHILQKGDVFIPADQRAGRLLNVLTEPTPDLEDTLTYDITSWSIALAYGDLYGLKKSVDGITFLDPGNRDTILPSPTDLYQFAAILEFRAEEDYHFLAEILKKGFQARVAEKPFSMNGQYDFPVGTVVLLKADNKGHFQSIHDLNTFFGNRLQFVATAWTETGPDLGSDSYKLLSAPKIALIREDELDVNGFGYIWHFLDKGMNYPYDVVSKDYFLLGMERYNTVVVPDGHLSFTEDEQLKIKEWISDGNKLIAIGSSAAEISSWEGMDVNVKVANTDSLLLTATSDYSSHNPGAVIRLEWNNKHPLAYHMEEHYFSLKTSGLAFENREDGAVGKIGKELKVYGFMGDAVQNKLNNSLLFAVEQKGAGKAVYMADDPLFRGFWKRGHQIMWNALFFVQ